MRDKPTYQELENQIAELKKQNKILLINSKANIEKLNEKAKKSKSEIKNQKEEIKLNNERLEGLLRISQFRTNSIQELLDFSLEEAIQLTNSKIGYIYFYNETTRQFILNTWSKKVMKECSVQNPQTVYDLDATGCWGEAVRQRKPIVINEYQEENPFKKGIPEGHVKLNKFLTIPVIFDNKIVAVAGVANKKSDYDNSDIRQLTLLMDNVWKISERVSFIDNLNKAKEKAEDNEIQLRELNTTKDKLFSIIAHDLRSPFNSIIGFSELLIENEENNDNKHFKKYNEIINSIAKNTLILLDNLLNWAKSQTGELNFKPKKIILSEVILEIIRLKKSLAKAKNISLHYSSINEIELFTDENILKTILRNLISNAVKFTELGGKINILVASEQDHIEITISDNGVGMNKETIQKLFNISTNVTTSGTTNEKGSGLGLVLCKEFVEKLGGHIWVESVEGKGSDFKFTLPLNRSK